MEHKNINKKIDLLIDAKRVRFGYLGIVTATDGFKKRTFETDEEQCTRDMAIVKAQRKAAEFRNLLDNGISASQVFMW